ncbi:MULTISPECIES: tyrosine-type recombinase/integrase [Deinococcus]|uniref:Integrase/recombinase XerC n=1 Tax=Deinococcus enclensis TaxID=1049582 RepID=A0ABT9M839_9DEIO|nr:MULTISPECIES: tyrosine-type recombinase/integrase [Deinococcus]MDP9762743.1 integrase/recombinase XerC [Deinococcus enclensis]GHF70251.1 integrase [Deinococcus ficus]
MTDALVPFTADALAQARSFSGLTDEALRVRAVTAARDKTFPDLWAITLAYLSTDTSGGVRTSPHTLRAYRKGVEVLVDHARDHAWNLLHPGRREPGLYVAALTSSGLKPATVMARVAAASALYRALRWAGATDADPFADVKRPRDRTKGIVKNPPYRPEFVQAMLEHADAQERALVLLMAHAGLRIAEALAVTWADVDLPRRRLLVAHGKGDKARRVPLSALLRDALSAWQAESGARGPARVFTFQAYSSAYERLRKLALRSGREHEFRGFHAGRKYAGTQLYAATKDFTRVAGFLGHEQVDTTRRYVEVPEDDLDDIVEHFR